MYLEVYPDIIFLLNFLLDFIILSLLKLVGKKDSKVIRRILAAAFGALIAAIAGIFPWMNIMVRFVIMNVGAAVIMLFLAFGRMKATELLRLGIMLYLVTYFFGGLLNSIYYQTNLKLDFIRLGNTIISTIPSLYILLPALLLIPVFLLLYRLFQWYRQNIRDLADVEIYLNDKSIRTKGLIDSGNGLYEPVYGKPVIVMENGLLNELLPAEVCIELENMKGYMEGKDAAGDAYSGLLEDYGLHLKVIPYQSIGKSQGIMLGLVLDKILINQGKGAICNKNITAAICDNCLSTKEEYHVILHKELLI